MKKTDVHSLISRPTLPRADGRMFSILLSVSLVVGIYSLWGRNPCFACIGAVFGMGSVLQGGLHSGGNRFIGTVLGGLLVIPFYWLYHLSPWPVPRFFYLILGLFLVLYVGAMFGAHSAIQPGTVVYFVVLYTVPPDRYITYTTDRILDTGLGVLCSLGLSALWDWYRARRGKAAASVSSGPSEE